MSADYGPVDSPALPGLTQSAVKQLSAGWDDGGLWDDVLFLADRFWDTSEQESRLISWHHLVLAVGNFKRQPGRRLRPSALHGQAATSQFHPEGETLVPTPDGPKLLCVDDPRTWRMLSRALPGAGVPTTAAILAALWPDDHFVVDWRVHAAANALRIHAGLGTTAEVDPASSYSPALTFGDYEQIRQWVLASAAHLNVKVTEAERSLYELSRRAGTDRAEKWQDYASRIYLLLPKDAI